MINSSGCKFSVTVLIHTFNAEKYIANCLTSLLKQSFEDFEILVVDKNSSDKTAEIAKSFDKTRVVNASIERSTQVNYGVSVAYGKYIFITAADMEFNSDYLRKAFEKCEYENYDAVYSSVETKNDTFWGKCKALERQCYVGDDFHETARFFRKDVFLALGGYDENLVAGEDYDFQRRLNNAGYKTGRVNVIADYHLGEEEDLGHIIRRSYYYGKTFYEFLKKNKAYGVAQMSPVRMAYFKKPMIWLKDPIHTAGFIVYKFLQYFFGSIGLIVGILKNYNIQKENK